MKTELTDATATIAAAILARYPSATSELDNEVIASAFLQAYQALQMGIALVDEEEKRGKPDSMAVWKALGS